MIIGPAKGLYLVDWSNGGSVPSWLVKNCIGMEKEGLECEGSQLKGLVFVW